MTSKGVEVARKSRAIGEQTVHTNPYRPPGVSRDRLKFGIFPEVCKCNPVIRKQDIIGAKSPIVCTSKYIQKHRRKPMCPHRCCTRTFTRAVDKSRGAWRYCVQPRISQSQNTTHSQRVRITKQLRQKWENFLQRTWLRTFRIKAKVAPFSTWSILHKTPHVQRHTNTTPNTTRNPLRRG